MDDGMRCKISLLYIEGSEGGEFPRWVAPRHFWPSLVALGVDDRKVEMDTSCARGLCGRPDGEELLFRALDDAVGSQPLFIATTADLVRSGAILVPGGVRGLRGLLGSTGQTCLGRAALIGSTLALWLSAEPYGGAMAAYVRIAPDAARSRAGAILKLREEEGCFVGGRCDALEDYLAHIFLCETDGFGFGWEEGAELPVFSLQRDHRAEALDFMGFTVSGLPCPLSRRARVEAHRRLFPMQDDRTVRAACGVSAKMAAECGAEKR